MAPGQPAGRPEGNLIAGGSKRSPGDLNQERATRMPGDPSDRDKVLDPSILESYRLLQEEGEPDLITELVDAFLADLEERIRVIRQAIARGDPAALRSAAHALKGSAGTVGATGLALRCGELEAAGREGRLEGADRLLKELTELIPGVTLALTGLRKTS